MSEAISKPRAEDIEARAAAWVVARRDRQGWSDEKQNELDAWLAQSPSHMVAYLRLDATWHRADWLGVLRRPARDDIAPRARNLSMLFRVSAAVVAVAGLSIGAYLALLMPREQTYATPLGAHETVTLADGSQVELNTNTVLRTKFNGYSRVAWLDRGEAYFQISHDPNRSFMVMAGARRVTVLGTKFLVRRDISQFELAVMEGRVRFEAANGKHTALMKAGDVAIDTPTGVYMPKLSARALNNELGWRHGVLVFDNTTLADAVSEFNRYNSSKLVVGDDAAAHLTIGGTFQTDNIVAFVRVVQEALGVHAESRGGVVVISAR